jgi:hypothetical protein
MVASGDVLLDGTGPAASGVEILRPGIRRRDLRMTRPGGASLKKEMAKR